MKKNNLSHILAISAVICFVALMVIVTIQVVFRVFPFGTAPSWSEEATRFLLIFSVTLCAPLAIKENAFVRVDLFLNHMPYKLRKVADITIYLMLFIFFSSLIYYAFLFAKNGIQTSPALRIPMYIPYGSTVIMMILLAIYALIKVKDIYTTKGNLTSQTQGDD